MYTTCSCTTWFLTIVILQWCTLYIDVWKTVFLKPYKFGHCISNGLVDVVVLNLCTHTRAHTHTTHMLHTLTQTHRTHRHAPRTHANTHTYTHWVWQRNSPVSMWNWIVLVVDMCKTMHKLHATLMQLLYTCRFYTATYVLNGTPSIPHF